MLRGTVENLQTSLRTSVSGNSTYTSLAVTGLALDRNGMLQMDTAKFQSALASKPAEVESLFGFGGVGGAFVTATDGITQFGIGTISQQTKSLDESSVRLQARADAAQKRLDEERIQLVARYSRMETLLSQLQQQGSVITNSLKQVSG
jgi:flagellar hook-associated protein 2